MMGPAQPNRRKPVRKPALHLVERFLEPQVLEATVFEQNVVRFGRRQKSRRRRAQKTVGPRAVNNQRPAGVGRTLLLNISLRRQRGSVGNLGSVSAWLEPTHNWKLLTVSVYTPFFHSAHQFSPANVCSSRTLLECESEPRSGQQANGGIWPDSKQTAGVGMTHTRPMFR